MLTSLPLFSADCWIESNGEKSVTKYVGDTVQLDFWIDTGTIRATGYGLYITIDPTIFRPVFFNQEKGEPFYPGSHIPPGNLPTENNTHLDVWGEPDRNGLPGFQLDYAALSTDNPRTTVSRKGLCATLYLEITFAVSSTVSPRPS